MEQQHAWPGFSPAPASVTMSPEQGFEFSNRAAGAGAYAEADSPLVFMRTPGVALNNDTHPDSSKRFNSWMESTSPYTTRKTPPTASMKSMAAGDENTPPVRHAAEAMAGQGSVGSQQHFQAWLQATNSNSWTPRKSPAAGTPPPAPAPSPAATPMSIMRDLQHSAATPPSTQQGHMAGPQHARMGAAAGPAAAAAARNEFDTLDEEDDEDAGEASTTIGAAQLAAAADRTAAASRLAGLRANSGSNGTGGGGSVLQQREMHTPPRVPAPSPVINSPAALTQQQQQGQLLQAAADRMVQDSLATPMSHLSISRRQGGAAQHNGPAVGAGEAMTPGSMLVDRSISRGAAALPASPAEKLIGLMMSPGAEGHRRHHNHHQHQHHQQQVLTPSRLSAALGGGGSGVEAPPLSPNLQVIGLMMQGEDAAGGAAAAGSSGEAPAAAQQQGAGGEAGVGAAEGASEGEARGSRARSSQGDDGSDDDGSSSSGSGSVFESDDEMDLSELQALCGEGVGPDTPLSVILGMMLSPQVAGLTPHLGAEEQQQHAAANDDLNPRILFADD